MTEFHLGWFSAGSLMTNGVEGPLISTAGQHIAFWLSSLVVGAVCVGFLLGLTLGAWFLLRDRIGPPVRENRRWTLGEWLMKHRVIR